MSEFPGEKAGNPTIGVWLLLTQGEVASPSPQLVSRPQSRGGCRLRSHGGSQWPDGFPFPSRVWTVCGLLRFSGRLTDERGPGHQIECRILQYRDLGGRHMAPKHHFGVRGQCPDRDKAAIQWSGIRRTQGIAPKPLTHNPNDTAVRIRARRPDPVCALLPSLFSGP